jgi:adenylosuccinate synthase
MTNTPQIRDVLRANDWFRDAGGYVQFDGQYGSTGKGLLASVIAEAVTDAIDVVATNAGPNSGHTAYHPLTGDKVMTQQIPVASAMLSSWDCPHTCYLNGGAVIEPSILMDECSKYWASGTELIIHPAAAVIHKHHQGDQLSHIASTGKGVGPAMADKLLRKSDVVWGDATQSDEDLREFMSALPSLRTFVETAQGWSLGINSGFYPHVTSRECSVAQAVADMGMPPSWCKKSIVSLRTYPIRVANHPDGHSSGGVYPDQHEITFGQLGQKEELTTVTKRVRRIFTWSRMQFREMLVANAPDAIFINFLNYLDGPLAQHAFLGDLAKDYADVMGQPPEFILGGFGPLNKDVYVMYDRDLDPRA